MEEGCCNDVGQGHTGPKTADQGQGIEPWTHEKIMLHGQGFKPWTHKNRSPARPWFEPWTARKDCSYNRARGHKISRAHEIRADAQMSSMWNVSAG